MSLEVVKQVYEHVANGDMDAIVGHCSEDVEWVVNGPAQLERSRAFEGPEGVRDFLDTIDRGWKYRFAAPREFIDAGDKIVVLGEAEGKERTSEQPFKSRWCHIFTIQNDKVVSFREFICHWVGDETPPKMSWR